MWVLDLTGPSFATSGTLFVNDYDAEEYLTVSLNGGEPGVFVSIELPAPVRSTASTAPIECGVMNP